MRVTSLVLAAVSAGNLWAEDPPPPETWKYKRFSAIGYVDVFYNYNPNHPANGQSALQAFNLTANRLSLSSATASMTLEAKPIGFRVDAGSGRTYDAFYFSEPEHTGSVHHLLNAYVSVKPKAWKGVEIDIGKFITSACAEVTEPYLNWNYSRPLVFSFAPYYHTGVRVTVPVKETWTVGGQLVTGWNTVHDNNTGKTVGLTSVNTFSKGTWTNTYYTGPENSGTNSGWRNFYDSALTITPAGRISAYVNLNGGNNHHPMGGTSSSFWGVSAATRFTLTRHAALTPRVEYYNDMDGFWTGTPQALKEFTVTGEYKLNASIITRLEYRGDFSNRNFFQSGPTPAALKHQTLVTAGLIFVIRPGMFKF